MERLESLRENGSLTEDEFVQAKQTLLNSHAAKSDEVASLGKAANRFVTFYIVVSVLGFLLAIGRVAGIGYFTIWYTSELQETTQRIKATDTDRLHRALRKNSKFPKNDSLSKQSPSTSK